MMASWAVRSKFFLLLLLPGLSWLILFFLIPLFIVFSMSYGQKVDIIDIDYNWNLQNYVRAMDGIYLLTLFKSLLISVITTFFCLLIATPVAFYISFSSSKIKSILLVSILLPLWTNLLIRTYSLIALLRTKGHVNNTLENLWESTNHLLSFLRLASYNLIGESFIPLSLMHNNFSVILGLCYIYVPFMIIPIYLVLEKIDRNILEASYDLGASHKTTFFKVILPNISVGIASGIILVFIPCLGSFIIPDLLGGADSQMIGNIIERQFKSANDWPFGSALSFILIYITIIILGLRYVYTKLYSRLYQRGIS